MISNEIRKQRALDVLKNFCSKDGAVFFTLTTPDKVDLEEIRARWRKLRHYLIQEVFSPGVKYVMNYELHPGGHGWHIHSVFSEFVPLRRIRAKLYDLGFGRVDVRRVWSDGVAEYLTKHALKSYYVRAKFDRMEGSTVLRQRLVNTSRGLPRLNDYKFLSDYKSGVLELKRKIEFVFRPHDFSRYFLYLDTAYMLGIRDWLEFSRFARNPIGWSRRLLEGVERQSNARVTLSEGF